MPNVEVPNPAPSETVDNPELPVKEDAMDRPALVVAVNKSGDVAFSKLANVGINDPSAFTALEAVTGKEVSVSIGGDVYRVIDGQICKNGEPV